MSAPVFYHGTRAGFRGRGGLLLPAATTGATPRAGHRPGGTDYVHLTTDADLAAWYAYNDRTHRGRPRVLTVAPLGPIEHDASTYDDETEDQFRCTDGARVLAVRLLPPPPTVV